MIAAKFPTWTFPESSILSSVPICSSSAGTRSAFSIEDIRTNDWRDQQQRMSPNENETDRTVTTHPEHFRRLQGDELVSRGDFVENEQQRLVAWEGPTGFRASSFNRPVYRVNAIPPTDGS